MKENKKEKKILIIAIIALLIIIIGLFIVLLLPDKKEEPIKKDIEKKSVDIEINVDNVNSSLEKNAFTNNQVGIYEIETHISEEGDVVEVVKMGEDTSAKISRSEHFYNIDEETALQYAERNYYPADCLQLIKRNIDNTNLSITESKDTTLVLNGNAFGDLGVWTLFDVYDTKEGKEADKIAVNIETGELCGVTYNGIFYDYRYYEYNPDWIAYVNSDEYYEDDNTLTPYDDVLVWQGIDSVVNYDKYPTKALTHFIDTDGTDYSKWTTDESDDYILINYYTGEMFQVVDGVRSSKITAFR